MYAADRPLTATDPMGTDLEDIYFATVLANTLSQAFAAAKFTLVDCPLRYSQGVCAGLYVAGIPVVGVVTVGLVLAPATIFGIIALLVGTAWIALTTGPIF